MCSCPDNYTCNSLLTKAEIDCGIAGQSNSTAVSMATESDSMLAEVFHCGQCQLDLSHMEFPQRVAHMKKCTSDIQQ